jgi:DNA-3-methyladenine glycosylase
LPRSFYDRSTHQVARDLLGKRLVRVVDTSFSDPPVSTHDLSASTSQQLHQRLSGFIVEVEAYAGSDDAASHAYRGRTERNASMFGRPGHAYVYFIYGMHWMFNVVAHTRAPGAVLVRALVPDEGLEQMRRYRGGVTDDNLTSGPARLAQALAIDAALDGADLCTDSRIAIEARPPVPDEWVACGPRVGVSGDDLARTRPWRFWVTNLDVDQGGPPARDDKEVVNGSDA